MKILMVSMRSLHFNRWVDQLADAGHEVYWFDPADAGISTKLPWVKQLHGWKAKFLKTKGRTFLKRNLPWLYRYILSFDQDASVAFEAFLDEIHPDIVHSFALQLSCLPIIEVMEKKPEIPWVYSSWGSDIYFHKEIGVSPTDLKRCLARINYLVTDNERDHGIAMRKGFKGKFLGAFPGNGGIDYKAYAELVKPPVERKLILIKGYHDAIGRGNLILHAIDEEVVAKAKGYEFVVFGADERATTLLEDKPYLTDVVVYPRKQMIANETLLQWMCDSYLYVGNSLSDGMPNTLLEAAGLGAFPIQSNPGGVTAEVIEDGENGLLIENAEDIPSIQKKIIFALENPEVVLKAFQHNTTEFPKRFDRAVLAPKVKALYEEIR